MSDDADEDEQLFPAAVADGDRAEAAAAAAEEAAALVAQETAVANLSNWWPSDALQQLRNDAAARAAASRRFDAPPSLPPLYEAEDEVKVKDEPLDGYELVEDVREVTQGSCSPVMVPAP